MPVFETPGSVSLQIKLPSGRVVVATVDEHAESHHIWAVLEAVRTSEDVLVFRLVRGKLTYAHRTVWPALVALADEIGHERLTAVEDVHTRAGHHEAIETPYPEWIPADVTETARSLPAAEARRLVAAALQ